MPDSLKEADLALGVALSYLRNDEFSKGWRLHFQKAKIAAARQALGSVPYEDFVRIYLERLAESGEMSVDARIEKLRLLMDEGAAEVGPVTFN